MGDLLAVRLLHAYIGGSEPQGYKALDLVPVAKRDRVYHC
jgi:hypothetical protein